MSERFDYAIIGAGAAGLNLAMRMLADPYFAGKRVLILDKDVKDENYKTWCFWEKGSGQWDNILHHSWPIGWFYGLSKDIRLDLEPYRYKMLRSSDFYSYCQQQLMRAENFQQLTREVREVHEEKEHVEITTDTGKFTARYVFDSRINPAFNRENDGHIRLWQHFKGWRIKTEKPVFNPREFVMMDFRLKWKGFTSFTYILPESEHEALVEFTLFTADLLKNEDYDRMISGYCKKYMGPGNFKVEGGEKGVIPMTDYPFHTHNSARITKIGAAGGWVRGSTGYSFRNSMKFSERIVENIKAGKSIGSGLSSPLHRKYDSIFLNVLYHRNSLGERVFTDMYSKNPIQRIFRFLDQESTRFDELRIIGSLPGLPFIDGLIKSM